MERTVDRTSYRRSVRASAKSSEKMMDVDAKKKDKNSKLVNMFLNQIIISLLIIIGILLAQYFEMTEVTDWITKNMSNGYNMLEVVSKIKNKFFIDHSSIYSMLYSGENSGENSSGENLSLSSSREKLMSGESFGSGELISAVEGVNQMIEDSYLIKANYNFYLPLKGTITSNFGTRVSDNPIVSSYHTGLDIAANIGTEIYAAHKGKVIMAKMFSSYGNCVMIEEGNLVTVYAHCSSLNVQEGQNVNQGDVIAKVGMTGNATGPHLHFEVRYEGRLVDPQKVLDEI